MPDLDAYAQISLINKATGAQALCLAATLTNGKTVYLNQVGWALGGLALAAFLAALVHSFWPLSPYKAGPEWRFATIMSYFQHVAMCGFISLNYPSVYKNFTLNFAWAQGLIYMRPIQSSINSMRSSTGGFDTFNRTYAVTATGSAVGNNSLDLARSFLASGVQGPRVHNTSSYTLTSGIESTTADLGIPYTNAFMTVFFTFLFFVCLMIAISLLATAGVAIYALARKRKAGYQNLRYFAWSNALRTAAVVYLPLVLFSFWQFAHRSDSGWGAVLIAALTFVVLHLVAVLTYWRMRAIARRAETELESTRKNIKEKASLRWTTVDGQFKRHGQRQVWVLSAAALISAAFVAFAQGHALVQIIPLIAVEVALFITFIIWRPFTARGSTVLMCFLSLFKFVAYGLLIAFWSGITINGIVAAVLGFVILAIQSIMVLVLAIVTIYNIGAGIVWARSNRHAAEYETGNTFTGENINEKHRSTVPLMTTNPEYIHLHSRSNMASHDTFGPVDFAERPASSLYAPGSPTSFAGYRASHDAENNGLLSPRDSHGSYAPVGATLAPPDEEVSPSTSDVQPPRSSGFWKQHFASRQRDSSHSTEESA